MQVYSLFDFSTERSLSRIIRWLEPATLSVFVFSVFLIPPFLISDALPSFYASDLLLPLMAWFVWKSRGWKLQRSHYVPFLLMYAGYILFTIIINDRLNQRSDYFEVLKVVKLAVAVMFVCQASDRLDVMRVLKGVFAVVLVFNVFQYTGWLGFNQIVEPFYSTPVQLNGFGLNSIVQPDTRRMLGTMGNPNDNAILFLFFFVLFMPSREDKPIHHLLLLLAFLGCLFSQSRTGILALVTVYIAGAVLMRYNIKTIAAHASIFIALYIPFSAIDGWLQTDAFHDQYVGTLASSDVVQTNSVQGRLEVWAYLWEMIKQKPLWGHAPYKEFFYSRNMFADGEYVLMAWRYGLVGFLLYLGSVWIPAFQGWQMKNSDRGKRMILFALVVGVAAVTNAPMNNPNMLMMFALMTGLFLKAYNEQPQHPVIPASTDESKPLRRRQVREVLEMEEA